MYNPNPYPRASTPPTTTILTSTTPPESHPLPPPTTNPSDGAPAFYDRALIDELLKKKRKARELKACYPCRQRKVKCNGEFPCDGCSQRCHPELCVMLGPEKRARQGAGGEIGIQSGGNRTTRRNATNDEETNRPIYHRQGNQDDGGISSTAAPSMTPPSHPPPTNTVDKILARLTAIEDSVSALKGDLLRLRESGEFGLSRSTSISQSTSATAAAKQSYPLDPPAPSDSSCFVALVSKRRQSATSGISTVTEKMGIHARDDMTGGTVYLGRNSVPAFVLGQQQEQEKGQRSLKGCGGYERNDGGLGGDLPLQVFALHNSTVTYPFTHLWLAQPEIAEIAMTLPGDEDILRYFQIYRDLSHRIYPVIVDIDDFEHHLRVCLRERVESQSGIQSRATHWKNPSWMALLFAILASGTQFSDDERKERELNSKVYVCCSFQCLRIANFFIQPTTEQIQALLLLGNCIRNDTNPGAAWILLGLTIRLAQSIGLHQKSSDLDLDTQEKHRKIWWSIIWQDTLLSFSYDRPHGAITLDCGVPAPIIPGQKIHFMDLMYAFLQAVIDFSLHNTLQPDTATTSLQISPAIHHFRDRISAIRHNGTTSPHSVLDQLERLTVRIHTGYIISQICRFVLRQPGKVDATDSTTNIAFTAEDAAMEQDYTTTFVENSSDVIEAFIEMHSISPVTLRSWAFIHNALSCALLLALLPDAPKQTEVKKLLKRMIACVEEIEADASGKTYSKSLTALKEIYESRVSGNQTEFPIVMEAERELKNSVRQTNGNAGWNAMAAEAAMWDGSSQARIMESIIWGWEVGLGDDLGAGEVQMLGDRM